MQNLTERCKHLHKLHDRLVEEIRLLKESLREVEQESFDNPIETVNVIRSLQDTLNTVSKELEKCPADYE
ncbi:MAG TPA: hypothetical protein VL485_32435 [Ktedonobacteraceae bacterium]|nr:hypothetical protein [Ktedonobacteraceae bacterium]